MRPNKLRQLLNDNKPSISTHIHTVWPSVVEAIGHTGVYDYIEFVAEYAPYTLHDLDNLCRAGELYDVGMMIKVDYDTHQFVGQRAIGSGFQSILFADCHNVEEARHCILSVKPDTLADGGLFGVGMRRHAYMGYGGGPEYVQALRDTVIMLMIEKKGAVDQLDEILALPGLDMIQWGGADYTMNINKAGQRGSDEIREVEKYVIQTALKKGVQPRAEIGSPEDAEFYLDLGVRHFCIGTDIAVLFQWFKNNGEALRRLVN